MFTAKFIIIAHHFYISVLKFFKGATQKLCKKWEVQSDDTLVEVTDGWGLSKKTTLTINYDWFVIPEIPRVLPVD